MIRNVESRNILQGLFNKWQGKDKEVINEAKVEDVQTTIMVEPPKLYILEFYKVTEKRWKACFGNYYLCTCYDFEKEKVEADFNFYKIRGFSTSEITGLLRHKYNVTQNKPNSNRGKYGKGKGNYSKDKYSFIREENNRVLFRYRFNKRLEDVCRCAKEDKEQIVEELEDLLMEDYSKTQIKHLLKLKYDGRKTRWLKDNVNKNSNKQSIPNEAPIVPLANYSWNDRGFLLKGAVNTHIVPADFNDIESVLANNGSTRSVTSLLPNCDYEALMDLSKYCKTEEYANLRREGIMIMNNR